MRRQRTPRKNFRQGGQASLSESITSSQENGKRKRSEIATSSGQTGCFQHPQEHLPKGDPGDLLSRQQGQLRQDLVPGGDGEGPQLVPQGYRA